MKAPTLPAMAMAIAASTVFAVPAAHSNDNGMFHYEITITNITRGQIIAPPAVVAHNTDYKMFTLGSPASLELAKLAEDGNGPLVLSAAALLPTVYATAIGSGGIMPGASQTIEIATTRHFSEISVAAMLATTNDGFMAVSGIRAPLRGEMSIEAIGYDAGSEANSDSCAYIPGPPCGDTSHNPAAAEGYVHVHAGMHGTSFDTFSPSQLDWRNPVAQIVIKRVIRR